MLTDEQRQTIEAEEQLRHEVRKRLDAENPQPPAQRLRRRITASVKGYSTSSTARLACGCCRRWC